METLASPNGTRRGGVAAHPVILADGQSWGLALPATRLKPEVFEDVDELGRLSRSIRLIAELGYPLEIRRLIEDLRSSCERGGPERQFEALIRLAASLIRRAHDIDATAADSLLELGVDDLPGLVEAVLSVVSRESAPSGCDEKGWV